MVRPTVVTPLPARLATVAQSLQATGPGSPSWGRGGRGASCGAAGAPRCLPRQEPSSPGALCLAFRYALLRKSKERQGLDGLNNLNYFANVTYDALYKNITVNLTPELAQVNEH